MTQTSLSEPFPKASRLLALCFLFVSALSVFTNVYHLQQLDFISFWAAAVLALQGAAPTAYDVEAHLAVQESLRSFDGLMPFAYPPPFLLLLLPVGLLPYKLAAAVWIAGTYFFYFSVAKRLMPHSGWLVAAFPPVLLNGIVGQNGFLTGALFVSGSLLLAKRPFLAGMVLGLLVIKPQLGILLPLAFIAAGQWRAFAGAAFSSVTLTGLAFLVFGKETYVAMMEAMPLFGSIVSDGLVGWHKMGSIYASLSLAGAPDYAAWTAHILVALGASGLAFLIWRRDFPLEAKCAALGAASMLISPYIFVYDAVMLIVPFLWLAKQEGASKLLVALWLIPLVNIGQSWGFNDTVNLMPLVPISLLALVSHRLFHATPAWTNLDVGRATDRPPVIQASTI